MSSSQSNAGIKYYDVVCKILIVQSCVCFDTSYQGRGDDPKASTSWASEVMMMMINFNVAYSPKTARTRNS